MDEQQNMPVPEEQEEAPAYVARPAWQVWGARVLLVIFLALVAMYYINIARGGR